MQGCNAAPKPIESGYRFDNKDTNRPCACICSTLTGFWAVILVPFGVLIYIIFAPFTCCANDDDGNKFHNFMAGGVRCCCRSLPPLSPLLWLAAVAGVVGAVVVVVVVVVVEHRPNPTTTLSHTARRGIPASGSCRRRTRSAASSRRAATAKGSVAEWGRTWPRGRPCACGGRTYLRGHRIPMAALGTERVRGACALSHHQRRSTRGTEHPPSHATRRGRSRWYHISQTPTLKRRRGGRVRAVERRTFHISFGLRDEQAEARGGRAARVLG